MDSRLNLKARLKRGETLLGTWTGIPSASVVDAVSSCGLDFVVVDTEHGPAGLETAENMVRAAQVNGVSAIVRVPSNGHDLILRALDIGSNGVQVPHVSTRAEAEAVIAGAKYFPGGERGYSPFTRAGRFGQNASNHIKDSNNNTAVVLNIEGKEGIRNIRKIAGVKGVDVLFVGPYDLSQSLGKPGDVENPAVVKAIRQCAAVAKQHGIACGSFARDRKYLNMLIDCGVRYITYKVDCAVISSAYAAIKDEFKAALAAKRK
jgi:4-hydroxy-2-oxoheptanedioate aldolase